jgi:hypothetical protein
MWKKQTFHNALLIGVKILVLQYRAVYVTKIVFSLRKCWTKFKKLQLSASCGGNSTAPPFFSSCRISSSLSLQQP